MTMLVLFFLVGLVLVAAGRERRNRRRFAEDLGTFRCRIRRRGRRWSRWMWARWSGELLVIRRGPVFDRTLRLAGVVLPEGVRRRRVRKRFLVAVRIRTAHEVLEMATEAASRTELVGPYLAAACIDLPQAPVRRRHEN
ncbi:hypothetical protein [Actinoplanes sp. L3-i22]|uniref:hypothetical protein n=1 Tax=Actinoplanes sp. L3-i22 TaxID=2836373 RepID=UPI001C78369D|nr:hypothetical protein [Actinoplanes sp. L3-i22]BCY11352.1 hypothetical protein L3i22_064400 [Actinoplanes sp. L3-i22]